jgi:hypothetical protein
MFGLTPITLYAIIGLLISNVMFVGLWQFADSRADKQEALVVACQVKHQAFVEQTEAAGKVAQVKASWQEAKYEKVLSDTEKRWKAAIAVVRADAAKRVHDAAGRGSGSGSVPQVSGDRPGDAVPDTDAIPSPARVAADCAETTVTANFLQSYIEQIEAIHE